MDIAGITQPPVVERDPQAPEDPRGALVRELESEVLEAKEHWSKIYDQMRADMSFTRGKQWPGDAAGMYVANMTQRHVQQRTSTLYAKNPKAVARRKDRIDSALWDGDPGAILQIEQSMAMGMPPSPEQMMMLAEVQRVQQERKTLDSVARTLELLYGYYVAEQVVPFKASMKQVVRRAITTGVAYVKLGFQRVMGVSPETERQIADFGAQLAHMERMAADLADGETQPDQEEAERLRLMIQSLQSQQEVIVREGLVYDFPPSTSIIPDKRCRSLNGFVGCNWIAQEYEMTPAEIQAIWNVDVGKQYRAYSGYAKRNALTNDRDIKGLARVWEIQHKRDGQVYWICEGFPNFLEEPAPPTVKLERFWTLFALMFNELEDDDCPFPLSDVSLMRPMQIEHNRARSGLIEHRKAALPWYAVSKGALDEEDREAVSGHQAHDCVELAALAPNMKIGDLIQAMTGSGVDPNLYGTAEVFDDILRVVGVQEANLGGTSSATATESSIAESSRLSSLESAVDELDEFLTELARNAGQILLKEVSPETVKNIVGQGAVWPSMSESEIADEIYLEIEAGSSGRPNREQDLMNLERATPLLLQLPGIRPEFLAKEWLKRLDDKLDLSQAYQSGLPSITAMNGAAGNAMGGDPVSNDPNAQGPEGANNQPGIPGPDTSNGNPVGRPPLEPANTRQQLGNAG